LPSSRGASSSKKIIIYAIIGILAVAAVSTSFLSRSNNTQSQSIPSAQEQRQQQLARFQSQFCGTDTKTNSNAYVTEVKLPSNCEMPVGIAVDKDHVWYIGTKNGTLGSYDLNDNKFGKEYTIPVWTVRSQPTGLSASETVKIDNNGNVWFTSDQFSSSVFRFNKNSQTFDMFNLPGNNSGNFPISFDFSSRGDKIYVLGIKTTSLFIGDIAKMKNGTSDGISTLAIPLTGWDKIDKFYITSGSLVVDKDRNTIWITVLAFQQKGQIFRYDLATNKFDSFDLPPDLNSPVGTMVDSNGNLWVTDHATNIFFKLDPTTKEITKFTTSMASPRIYGGTTPPNAYTLPYWFQKSSDGQIWFNEHTGNKIARFDPVKQTLIEYWIPSQNKLWVECPPNSNATCGIANVLQFSVGPNDKVWFGEWTENKIGKIDSEKPLPFSVSAPSEITVQKGNSAAINVIINASENFSGQMLSAGTFTATGSLGNSTGIFSQESVSVPSGKSGHVLYTFTPDPNLQSGQYTLMLGVGNDDVDYLKAIKVNVTS
jgi:virginiamycin B lyase